MFFAMKWLTLLLLLPLTFCTLEGSATPLPAAPQAGTQEARYWINSRSGKTHNRRCRYYSNCKGYPSNTPSGDNCKLCGGSGH